MTPRAKQLLTVGTMAYLETEVGGDSGRMLAAMAAMVDAALPAARAVAPKPPLPMPPQAVYELFKKRTPVLCYPLDRGWFGRIANAMRRIDGLTVDDIEVVLCWIEAGALNSWPNGAPTFANVCNLFPQWVVQSRQWDSNGRQTLRGGKLVGTAAGAEAAATWGSFSKE